MLVNYAFLTVLCLVLSLGPSELQSLYVVMFVQQDRLKVGPTLLGSQ